MKGAGAALLLAAWTLGCGPAPVPREPTPPTPAAADVALGPSEAPAMGPAATRRLAGLARFLAGLEAAAPAGVEPAVAARHAAEMTAAWERLERERLAPMREWAARSIVVADPEAPVFYPFGGPDVVGALTFFPAARSSFLVGLESPGEIALAEPARVTGSEVGGSNQDLAADLERLRGSFASLVDEGYFVTQRMRSDFAGGSLEGVLPVVLVLLVRSGYEPVGAWYLEVDDEGTLRYPPPDSPRRPGGVRVDFHRAGGDAVAQTLIFLSQDLGDEALATAPGVSRLVRRLAPFHTLMKAAHYLLHGDGFATVAGLVVEGSTAILQDDSGLPLGALDPARFELELFGRYGEGSLPAAYRNTFQPDLAARFAAAQPAPLGFTLGYQAEVGGGALMLARKR